MKATCIHESDVARLRVDVRGRTADGEPILIPSGTEATVILEHRGAEAVELEVVDERTGAPRAFVAAPRSALEVVWRAASKRAA
jgi:hypothetical protein